MEVRQRRGAVIMVNSWWWLIDEKNGFVDLNCR
jgi:hypothetical protein